MNRVVAQLLVCRSLQGVMTDILCSPAIRADTLVHIIKFAQFFFQICSTIAIGSIPDRIIIFLRLEGFAIVRPDIANLNGKVRRRDACRLLERLARCAVCELVILVLQFLQAYRRIVDIVADIFRDATICRTRKCTRVRNVKKQRAIAIDTRKGGLAEWICLTILRRVERFAIWVDDVLLRKRVRYNLRLAVEVRDFVVRQVVDAFTLEVIVAGFPRPLAILAVKRCIVRVFHATECRIQSCLRIAILDARFIRVPILRFIELRTIDRRRIANLNGQASLLNMQFCRVHRDVVVLQLVDARRDVIVTNAVRLRVAEVTLRHIRQVHNRLTIAVRQALDIRLEVLVDRTIRRRLVFRINRKRCFVDFKVTLCVDDFVVDACTILEADIFHIDGIRIRLFIGISCRTSSLVASIETAGLNGKVICAIVERVVIFFDKGFARCAFLIASERCSECPVVDGCGAVGLAAAAVHIDPALQDLDRTALDLNRRIAAIPAEIRQAITFLIGLDFIDSCMINATVTRRFLSKALT